MNATRFPYPPPVARPGDTLAQLNTPALIVDLEAFEANLDQLAALSRQAGVALRPHAKAHKTVAVAQAQLARGAIGICCQKLSEAYPFAAAGIKDILISNEFVGPAKVAMAIELAARITLRVCVDHVAQVEALGAAAVAAGVTIGVLVEVDIGQGRCGVPDQVSLLAVVRAVQRFAALRFDGLQAYHGGIQHLVGHAARRAAAGRAAADTAGHVAFLAGHGIGCSMVAGGGTGSVEFDLETGVYTELQAGSYALMDRAYGSDEWGSAFRPRNALLIATTVMSTDGHGRAVLDVGLKGLTLDSGLPLLHGVDPTQAEVVTVNDEHSVVALRGATLPLGSQALLVPGHCDPTVNLWDHLVGLRNGVVESVWAVSARGLSR